MSDIIVPREQDYRAVTQKIAEQKFDLSNVVARRNMGSNEVNLYLAKEQPFGSLDLLCLEPQQGVIPMFEFCRKGTRDEVLGTYDCCRLLRINEGNIAKQAGDSAFLTNQMNAFAEYVELQALYLMGEEISLIEERIGKRIGEIDTSQGETFKAFKWQNL